MGSKINNIVTTTFSYPVPDDYLHQTNSQNKTGTYSYTGPDKLWVFVDNTTGKLPSGICYTERDDGEDIPTPEGWTKVCVDSETEPALLSMIWNGDNDYSALPTKTENLPDGHSYTRPDPTPPDHTYELMDCVYNVVTKSWNKPFPWKQSHMDWDQLKAARVALLNESDQILTTKQLTDEQKAAMEVYRQKLRDFPVTFAGIDPWKVSFPEIPDGVR